MDDFWQLTQLIGRELISHDYYPLIHTWKSYVNVTQEDIYEALLDPQKAIYITETMKGGGQTVLQANATLFNMLGYACYCGYLYAYIRDNDLYDNNVWSYVYMHRKLNGHIYEPYIISLLPQVYDYTLPMGLQELYIPEASKIFLIIFQCISGYFNAYHISNDNIYKGEKTSDFYKKMLPQAFLEMHRIGASLYLGGQYDHTRLEDKNILSNNLRENLNTL